MIDDRGCFVFPARFVCTPVVRKKRSASNDDDVSSLVSLTCSLKNITFVVSSGRSGRSRRSREVGLADAERGLDLGGVRELDRACRSTSRSPSGPRRAPRSRALDAMYPLKSVDTSRPSRNSPKSRVPTYASQVFRDQSERQSMPWTCFQAPMAKGWSLQMPRTLTPSVLAMDWRAWSWHWHPPSASPEKAAGKKARTTLLPLRSESLVTSKPSPMRAKSGALSPTLTAALVVTARRTEDPAWCRIRDSSGIRDVGQPPWGRNSSGTPRSE